MSTIYYTVTISLPYLLEAIDVVDGVGDTAVLRLGGVEEVHLQHSTAVTQCMRGVQPLHSREREGEGIMSIRVLQVMAHKTSSGFRQVWLFLVNFRHVPLW